MTHVAFAELGSVIGRRAVAALFGVTEFAIAKGIEAGRYPVPEIVIGGRRFYSRRQVRSMLEKRERRKQELQAARIRSQQLQGRRSAIKV